MASGQPADPSRAEGTGGTEQQRAPVALALVIDRSGSMTGHKMEAAKRACRDAVDELASSDWITVVAFDSSAANPVPLQQAQGLVAIRDGIDQIEPAGGTHILPALQMAYQQLKAATVSRKQVVLLSDGRAPLQGVADIARAMGADGITISTVGIGDYDAELLETIAREGGGRFHGVTQVDALPTVFRTEVAAFIASP